MQTTLSMIHCSSSFFGLNVSLDDYFSSAFNASFVYQIWQKLHTNDILTFYYTTIWTIAVDWHYICNAIFLNWLTQTTFSYQIWQLIITTLSQWLECFRVESRTEILFKERQDCSISLSINKGRFYYMIIKKLETRFEWKKPSSSP